MYILVNLLGNTEIKKNWAVNQIFQSPKLMLTCPIRIDEITEMDVWLSDHMDLAQLITESGKSKLAISDKLRMLI